MNILLGSLIIWAAALWLWRRLPDARWRVAALRASRATLAFTLPRVVVALIGAGCFAELLPQDRVQHWFGAQAGLAGLALAIALGPVTPGGAFVAFAIAAAALKAGAAPLAAIAYVTAWALFSLTKLLAYELPLMGREATLVRLAVSWPVPLLVAGLGLLVAP